MSSDTPKKFSSGNRGLKKYVPKRGPFKQKGEQFLTGQITYLKRGRMGLITADGTNEEFPFEWGNVRGNIQLHQFVIFQTRKEKKFEGSEYVAINVRPNFSRPKFVPATPEKTQEKEQNLNIEEKIKQSNTPNAKYITKYTTKDESKESNVDVDSSVLQQLQEAFKQYTNARENECVFYAKQANFIIKNEGVDGLTESEYKTRSTAVLEFLKNKKPDVRADNFWDDIRNILHDASSKTQDETGDPILNKLLEFERKLKEKDERIEEMIRSLNSEREEIRSCLTNIREEIKKIQQAETPTTPQSTSQYSDRPEEPKQVEQKPEQVDEIKEIKPTEEKPTEEKPKEDSKELKQYNPDEIQKTVESLVENKKMMDAIKLVEEVYSYEIPFNIISLLCKGLERPGEYPRNIEDKIIGMFLESMQGTPKRNIQNEYFALQRKLVTTYGRFSTIRNLKAMKRIIGMLVQNQLIARNTPGSITISMTLPNFRNCTFFTLMSCQHYLSTLIFANPKKSYRLVKIYEKIKEKIVEEEAKRSAHVRSISVNSLKLLKHSPEIEEEKEEKTFTQQMVDIEILSEEEDEGEEDTFDEEEDNDSHENTSSLTAEVMEIFDNLHLTEEEYEYKKLVCDHIESICKQLFDEKCKVYMYGSSANNFGLRGCDLDLCIRTDTNIIDNKVQSKLLQLLQKAIDSDNSELKHIKSKDERVIRSRVPVLKLEDSKMNTDIDICMDNFLGVMNTRMIYTYSLIDDRVRPVAYAVKYWTKKRKINDPPSGTLSSYTYVLMVINYLQTLNPPILPSLQALALEKDMDPKNISEPQYVYAYDCRFFQNIQELSKYWKPKKNRMTVGELVKGFFEFYATKFDFEHNTASIRLGEVINKKSNLPISVEDPFEKRDLGAVVLEELAPVIIEEFKRAHEILSSGGSFSEVVIEKEGGEEVNRFAVVKQDYPEYPDLDEVMKMIEEKKLYKGVLKVNKKKYREAFVEAEGIEGDVWIDGFKARNRALHGDVVAIKILEESNGQKNLSGTVVAVLEKRSTDLFVCTLMKEEEGQTGKGYRWLLPIDKTLPKVMVNYDEFRNVFGSNANCLEDLIFLVEIVRPWKKTQHHPKGKLITTLGLKKDLWTQKKALLIQNVPLLFDKVFEKENKQKKVKTYVTNNDPTVSQLNIEQIDPGYKDFRDKCIFTIDPPTSRDLDDAISIEAIGNDEYLIGVFVADVSRFIKEGDDNDEDAKKRATSIYMIDVVEHMLDPSLSQNLCSLHAGLNRYAIAVTFKMNSKAELKEDSVEFHKVLMCSAAKLSYDIAQEVIEGKEPKEPVTVKNGFTWDQIKEAILNLNKLATQLRAKRKENGSLFLNKDELQFELNDDGYPIGIGKSEKNESHSLIEEFMLVANQLAAKALFKYRPDDTLLRSHSPPDDDSWKAAINELVRAYNIRFPNGELEDFNVDELLQSGWSMQKIMNLLFEKTKRDKIVYKTVQHVMLREMYLAKYTRFGDYHGMPSATSHFALNWDIYTHFTSPIRRYADTIVHRNLIRMMDSKEFGISGTELSNLVKHINDQALKAKNLQEQCEKLYLIHYLIPLMREKLIRVEAVVLSLGKRSFTVFIPEFSIELKCNIMKTFAPVPDSITETERDVSENEKTVIDSLTLTWKNVPSETEGQEKVVKLHVLKTVLLDLDIDYETVPYDIFAFNIWEYDPILKNSVRLPKIMEKKRPKVQNRTLHKRRGGTPRGRGRGRKIIFVREE